MSLAAVPLALAVDALVGDPPGLWRRVRHPVVWMGAAVFWLDHRLNRGRRVDGVIALATLLGLAVGPALALSLLLPGGILGLALEAVLAATLLAHNSLHRHVAAVAAASGLAAAREAVGQIVGRQTAGMDEADVARAALESLGENFSDGVVAPAFWLAVGGLPGIVAYKAINTADSMIGHRTVRYEAFGWAAARLDDVANFVPARLTAALIALTRPSTVRRWAVVRDGARRHASPNAGWPEAALALNLAVSLGGPRHYGDRLVDGVRLNPQGRAPTRRDIGRGLTAIAYAGLLQGLLYLGLAAAL